MFALQYPYSFFDPLLSPATFQSQPADAISKRRPANQTVRDIHTAWRPSLVELRQSEEAVRVATCTNARCFLGRIYDAVSIQTSCPKS